MSTTPRHLSPATPRHRTAGGAGRQGTPAAEAVAAGARHARCAPTTPGAALRRSRLTLGVAAAVGVAVAPVAAASGASAAAPAPTASAGTVSNAPVSTGTVSTAPVTTGSVTTVTVRSGDTLGAIAHRAGTSVAALVAANHLSDPNRLRVGQVLTVPSTGTLSKPSTSTATGTSSKPVSTTTAGSGSGVTATPAVVTSTAAPKAGTWTVRSGDTLAGIAQRTGSSVAALVAANHLSDPNRLKVGQVLTVPAGSGHATGPHTTTTTSTTSSSGTGSVHTAVATTGGSTGGSPPSVGTTFAGRTYTSSVTANANADAAALAATAVPTKAQMQAMVVATATSMGVDPALAQAIAYQESGFNMRAVSPADAVGVMQVVPSSGAWASSMVGRTLDLRDPQDNVTAGVAILRSLVKAAPDTPTAIAGYYQGLAGVLKNGMYPDTKAYVASVTTLMARFSA